jgi:hypothetical protein
VQKAEVLQYGDEPVVEPGQVTVRVILNPTDEDPHETIKAFEKAHQDTITELRARIAQNMPFIGRLQFTVPLQEGKRPVITMPIGPPDRTAIGRNLTPVICHCVAQRPERNPSASCRPKPNTGQKSNCKSRLLALRVMTAHLRSTSTLAPAIRQCAQQPDLLVDDVAGHIDRSLSGSLISRMLEPSGRLIAQCRLA